MKEGRMTEKERSDELGASNPKVKEGTTPFGPPGNGGERSETEFPGGPKGVARHGGPPLPDSEVSAKATRRRFTAKYKLRILEEIDGCTENGQIGSILRREGLYSSSVSKWREQRDKGILASLKPKTRGRKPQAVNPLSRRLAQVERENERLKKKLEKAETIIDFQKKLSDMLGISPSDPENGKSS